MLGFYLFFILKDYFISRPWNEEIVESTGRNISYCIILYWERPVWPRSRLTTATHSSRYLEAFHCSSVVSGWWSIGTWSNGLQPFYILFAIIYIFFLYSYILLWVTVYLTRMRYTAKMQEFLKVLKHKKINIIYFWFF